MRELKWPLGATSYISRNLDKFVGYKNKKLMEHIMLAVACLRIILSPPLGPGGKYKRVSPRAASELKKKSSIQIRISMFCDRFRVRFMTRNPKFS